MYPRSRDRRRRHGNIALLTALMITMLIAFVALSFDVGNMYRVKTETQTGMDAAALAGAMALSGGTAAAQASAVATANQHFANTGNLTLNAGGVEVGVWDQIGRSFLNATPVNGSPATFIPAVRVTFNQLMNTPFAGVGGTRQETVGARATAMRGGPVRAACGFPLVISATTVANAARTNCDICLQLQDAVNDNAGWTAFSGAVSGPTIRTAVTNACYAGGAVVIGPDGACAGSCAGGVTVGQTIPLNSGNLMNAGNNNFCPLIEDLLRRGVPNGPASPFSVDVAVISGTTFNGSQNVVGLSRLTVWGVRCTNARPAVQSPGTPPPSCPAASANKYLIVSLRRNADGTCDMSSRNTPGTGAYYGTYGRPVLVQ